MAPEDQVRPPKKKTTGKYWKYNEEDLKEFTADPTAVEKQFTYVTSLLNDPWTDEMKWTAEMSFALKVVAARDRFHLVGVGNFDRVLPEVDLNGTYIEEDDRDPFEKFLKEKYK